MILSGQLPSFVHFLMEISQQSLTIWAIFFVPVEYSMVTPARTLRKHHACKSDSSDTEHHFLLTISDMNLNKLFLLIIRMIFNDLRCVVQRFLFESHIQVNNRYLLHVLGLHSDRVIASKHCAITVFPLVTTPLLSGSPRAMAIFIPPMQFQCKFTSK